jgi:prophage DNA circulation protein
VPPPLAGIAPTTYAAVAAYRTKLLDAVDALELEAVSDDVYLALRGLGAAISAQLTAFGASLRPLVPYTTAFPRAALVLAQRFYQDVTRADEIVTLTHAAHPGFLPTSGLIASS